MYVRIKVIMGFEKSNESATKNKLSRVHSQKNIGFLNDSKQIQFMETDDYIMDVMEQTQIN